LLSQLLGQLSGERSAVERVALCALLTLLAEELTSPAGKTSVPPVRLQRLRVALRADAPRLLPLLGRWYVEAIAGSAGEAPPGDAAAACLQVACGALSVARAWGAAGLVAPSVAAQCALLTRLPAEALQLPPLEAHAAEVLCVSLPLLAGEPPAASFANPGRDGAGGGGSGEAAAVRERRERRERKVRRVACGCCAWRRSSSSSCGDRAQLRGDTRRRRWWMGASLSQAAACAHRQRARRRPRPRRAAWS